MKDLTGYEIVVAKGGPKLTPAAPSSDKFPVYRGSRDANGLMRYTFTKTSMKLLTHRIEIMLRMTSPVVDHTALDGKFDFHLDVEMPPQFPGDPATMRDSISDAMQNQLGMKLNRVKIPLEVLVVDHVDREPAAN